MVLKLKVISGSTRPGRVGIHVARWVQGLAAAHPAFESELVDLGEIGLPVYDEPRHPRLRRYEHAHTRAWSAIVEAADAYVFVMPEYNHSPSPALLNALDFVLHEWAYKPAGLVSYGGVSGGLRGAQLIKPTLLVLKVVPIAEGVVVPFVAERVKDGAFSPNEVQAKAGPAMLDELARWAEALKPLRSSGG